MDELEILDPEVLVIVTCLAVKKGGDWYACAINFKLVQTVEVPRFDEGGVPFFGLQSAAIWEMHAITFDEDTRRGARSQIGDMTDLLINDWLAANTVSR